MTDPGDRQYDPTWRRREVGTLLVLCLAAAAWVGAVAARQRWLDTDPAPDAGRVRQARETIDPNTAGVASMRRLRGIGPAKAKAIVAYRRAHGPRAFRSADDLRRVPGIGPHTVRRIRGELALPPRSD